MGLQKSPLTLPLFVAREFLSQGGHWRAMIFEVSVDRVMNVHRMAARGTCMKFGA